MIPSGSTRATTVVANPVEVGRLVRSRRKALGLRQDELALAAGTGRRFIGELERGKRTLRLGDVLKVLRALGIELTLAVSEVREEPGDRRA